MANPHFSRRSPFEILGGKYVEANSAAEAAAAAGLDWTVSLQPLTTTITEDLGNDISRTFDLAIEGKWATVRSGGNLLKPSVLGVVGSRYGVVQNADMFGVLDSIVDSGDARYAAAGELNGGSIVYMLMELPDGVKIEGDPHRSYLLARTSHDGSTSLQITSLIQRLACTNQINASFLRNKKQGIGVYSLKHMANAQLSASEVRHALGVVYSDIEWYNDMSKHLLSIKMDEREMSNFAQKVWSLPPEIEGVPYTRMSTGQRRQYSAAIDARTRAMSIWRGETQDNLRGTAFGAFQAVVEQADWYSAKTLHTLASRSMSGSLDAVKGRALQLLGVSA